MKALLVMEACLGGSWQFLQDVSHRHQTRLCFTAGSRSCLQAGHQLHAAAHKEPEEICTVMSKRLQADVIFMLMKTQGRRCLQGCLATS